MQNYAETEIVDGIEARVWEKEVMMTDLWIGCLKKEGNSNESRKVLGLLFLPR